MFNISGSIQCPIKEVSLVDAGSTKAINANFEKSVGLKGVVNGTESGLVIKNNVKID